MALLTLGSWLSTNSMMFPDPCGRRGPLDEPLDEPLLDVLDTCPDVGLFSRDFSSADDMDSISVIWWSCLVHLQGDLIR